MFRRAIYLFLSFAPLAVHADLVLRLDAGNLPSGPLANWGDSSGNGFDASQGNASNQPSVVNGGAGINNLNVVEFNGMLGSNSDYLQNTAVNYDGTTAGVWGPNLFTTRSTDLWATSGTPATLDLETSTLSSNSQTINQTVYGVGIGIPEPRRRAVLLVFGLALFAS